MSKKKKRVSVPWVLTCLRANVYCVLTRSHVNVPFVLPCSRASVPCVLTCLRVNVPCVLTCPRALRAYVLMCQRALRVYVLKWQRALRANGQLALCAHVQKVSAGLFHHFIFLFLFFVSQLIQTMPWESQKFNCIVGFCQYVLFFFCYFWT